MSAWTSELHELMQALLANPHTDTEALVVSIATILSLVIVLRLTAGPFGITLTSWARVLPLVLLALVLSFVAAIAVRLYVVPKLMSPAAGLAVQITAVVLVNLIVIVPLETILLKGSYPECLLNIAVSVVAAIVIGIAVRAGWRAVLEGLHIVEKDKQRREWIKEEVELPWG